MQITTSWMEEGIEQGIERGIEQGVQREAKLLVFRLLNRRVGELPLQVRSQVETLPLAKLEALGEALLDFSGLPDLEAWLAQES